MQKNRNKQINHKIYAISITFFLMFGLLSGFLVWFNMSNQSEFFNNSYNSRQELLAARNIRGTIYSADGEKLAYTVTSSDKTEERVYPYGEIFCHVIGYANHGKSGVEALANYELSHSNLALNNKVSSSVAGEKNPADNVYTTFDASLQE